MPLIELRKKSGTRSPADVTVSVQDKTYEYLQTTISPEVRISAFFEKDYDLVENDYVEVFVSEDCKFNSRITSIIPGSRTRKGLTLPCAMQTGEQLTVMVARSARN